MRTDISEPSIVRQHFGRVVSIDSEGEYHLRVVDESPPDSNAPFAQARSQYIPLRAIFDAHTKGTLPTDFPQLTMKDVHLVAAFLATNDPTHPAYHHNNRDRRVKILFDENLPYALVSALTNELPNLSHVYLEGLDGATDEFLFYRPRYQLKKPTPYERKCGRTTKYIIISRDGDMTDLVRQQWIQRLSTCANPEHIRMDDVNVVMRVRDQDFTNIESVDKFVYAARDILKAAYSGEGASYIVGREGVRVEPGSHKHQLIARAADKDRVERAQRGELTSAERLRGISERYTAPITTPAMTCA